MEIRTMLPWNIRCNTCGHYMHRGTKFNSRVEAATDYPKYLEYITIRRFYIRCLNCVSNITFVTDPEAVVSLSVRSGFEIFGLHSLNWAITVLQCINRFSVSNCDWSIPTMQIKISNPVFEIKYLYRYLYSPSALISRTMLWKKAQLACSKREG